MRRATVTPGDRVSWGDRGWTVVRVTSRGRAIITDGMQVGVVLVEQLVWEDWAGGWLLWESDEDGA